MVSFLPGARDRPAPCFSLQGIEVFNVPAGEQLADPAVGSFEGPLFLVVEFGVGDEGGFLLLFFEVFGYFGLSLFNLGFCHEISSLSFETVDLVVEH